jgi:GNAT superfamily N-acetyltransferase
MRLAKKCDVKKVAHFFRELDSDLNLEELANLIREKRVFVLRDRKKTLGAFSFLKIGVGIFTILYIRKLVIDKKFRGQGLGGRVLKKIYNFTRRKKARGFFLWSRRPAENFYRKNKLKNWWRFFWRRAD